MGFFEHSMPNDQRNEERARIVSVLNSARRDIASILDQPGPDWPLTGSPRKADLIVAMLLQRIELTGSGLGELLEPPTAEIVEQQQKQEGPSDEDSRTSVDIPVSSVIGVDRER